MSIEEAVSLINDGDNLSISGFAHSLTPLAIIREMIRQGKKNLETTSMGECWAADFLCAVGGLRRVRISNYMFEGFGRCMNFSRAAQEGKIQVEDYSHFGITSRLVASAMGVSFLPVKVMAGTDILNIVSFDEDKFKIDKCPFTGEKYVLVKAISPDVAIIHASRADKDGNVQIFGSTSIIDEQARASKKVIVSVEEIVEREEISKCPELTILPGFMVDAVVEIPYGAHPAGMYRYYNYDSEHIRYYWDCSKDEEKFQQYLQEFVYSVSDHFEYLNKIGIKKLMALRADPYLGY
jgi:acyl CoA:acetate/3-ketoacid CoA transferase alpha subunit